MRFRTLATTILAAAILTGDAPCCLVDNTVCQAQTSRSSRKRTAAKTSGAAKGNGASKSAGKKKSGLKSRTQKTSGASSRETSADVRRREEATRREIALTKEQIKENDLAVKRGLNDLGKLQTDIDAGKKKLAAATTQVRDVERKIGGITGRIDKGEKDLARLRAEYLKAVKKMRIKKKQTSSLAFIFASKDFNEALRRMRYLRQFAAWRDKQSADIGKQIKALGYEKELLAQTRVEKQNALKAESSAQASLQVQYREQDAVVAKLKENGNALRTHLARKQQEANTLRGRISALIAEEQRRAEQQRREQEARETAARKAEEERLAAIEAKRLAEEKARADEQARAEETARQEKESRNEKLIAQTPEKPKAEKPRVRKPKAEKPKKEKPANTRKEPKQKKKNDAKTENAGSIENTGTGDYALARRRRPRGDGKAPSATSSPSANVSKPARGNTPASSSAAGNFASMRGSLPRPVAGPFKITSPFGAHSLPDLPDVKYDNPGIDAEVSAGASAQAVYAGKVSGVYVIPGYSTVVIVNHGNYYTVYGNIQSPAVKVGDTVKQGTNLGRLAPAEEDPSHSSIHFEVWHNRDKQNPASWIR